MTLFNFSANLNLISLIFSEYKLISLQINITLSSFKYCLIMLSIFK